MPGRAGAVSREYSPRGNANGVTFDVTIYFRIRLFRLFSGVPVRRATVVATRVLARLGCYDIIFLFRILFVLTGSGPLRWVWRRLPRRPAAVRGPQHSRLRPELPEHARGQRT